MKQLNVSWADGCTPAPPPTEVEAQKQYFVKGSLATSAGPVPVVAHDLGFTETWGRWKARWGYERMDFTVAPGLYAFGNPAPDSPVVISCNYKMTFDLLRGIWKGLDLWVLVLDTRGVNVWCAAGKGTFGTQELISRIERSSLGSVVTSREVIVPQLGAPGVDAWAVKKATGFKVVYGPVRAEDLSAFLQAGRKATAEMRRVKFSALERLVLTPIELTGSGRHLLWALTLSLLVSGFGSWGWDLWETLVRGLTLFGAALTGLIAGAVLTPVALPLVPGRMFSLKGAFLGALLAFPIANLGGMGTLAAIGFTAGATAVSSFAAMNFTGASTFTSQSGVLKEMKISLPVQLFLAMVSLATWVASGFFGGRG